MDYKKSNAPLNTVTRDMIELSQDTGNVYETVCIIAKRANQIAGALRTCTLISLGRGCQGFKSVCSHLSRKVSSLIQQLPCRV